MPADHDDGVLDDLRDIQRAGRRRALQRARPALIVCGVFVLIGAAIVVLVPELRSPEGIAAVVAVEAIAGVGVFLRLLRRGVLED